MDDVFMQCADCNRNIDDVFMQTVIVMLMTSHGFAGPWSPTDTARWTPSRVNAADQELPGMYFEPGVMDHG